MNYLPPNYSNAAYFYAQGLGGPLGSYAKSMQSRTILTVDYAGVLGMPNPPNIGGNVTITNVTFVLDTQSMPPIIISKPELMGQLNVLSFTVTGGYGGVEYDLSINTKLSNGATRVDTLALNIISPYDNCGCSSCGCSPCECVNTSDFALPQEQVAILTSVNPYFGTSYPQYYVSNTEPQNPNLMDQWFNPTTNILGMYVTDGKTNYWQQVLATVNGAIQSPVVINNSLTVNSLTVKGAVNLTLDMGTY